MQNSMLQTKKEVLEIDLASKRCKNKTMKEKFKKLAIVTSPLSDLLTSVTPITLVTLPHSQSSATSRMSPRNQSLAISAMLPPSKEAKNNRFT